MGSYLSRNSGDVEELNIPSSNAYRYPPKSGNYFGSHFIMGGTKFETIQPEAYLFGDNSDLNFLGPKPYNFPYKISSPSQPVRALRCLVNVRKDSLRLVKVPSASNKTITNEEAPVEQDQDRQITAEEGEGPFLYNIEFTFDADCPCSITIYYNATEEMFNKNVIYSPDPARDCSDTIHYNAGCNQQFCLPTHRIDPAKLAVTGLDWTKGYTKIPIVIQACADCGPNLTGHCHITYAEFYKPLSTTWSIRAIKQKQAIDGVCYLLQEIYGIENKNISNKSADDDDDDDEIEDDSADCVVCLSEPRDTLILPCKHLCLCSTCANQLRYQQSGCPICRQSFRALLQIRAVRKKTHGTATDSLSIPTRTSESQTNTDEAEEDAAQVVVPVPPGYEVVPLIEAIKGSVITPVRAATEEPSIASTSLDNITVVDETANASASPCVSSMSILNKAKTMPPVIVDTDSDSEEEAVAVPLPGSPVSSQPMNCPEKVLESDDDNEQDEVSVLHEIPLPGATTSDAAMESSESQNSAKELMPKSKDSGAKTDEESENELQEIVI